jgi:peptidoglycan/xylan/chitin deacetylase (PgdA/CDA1 family)
MTSLTNEQAFAELYFSKKAIKEVLGITVRCWRPPYGDVDDRIRFISEALDMRTIMCVALARLPSLPFAPAFSLSSLCAPHRSFLRQHLATLVHPR